MKMENSKTHMASLLAIALTLTALILFADASGNFCGTALNKPLCEQTVKGVANWNEAITKAVTAALDQLGKVTKDATAKGCKEAYRTTGEGLKESMELIKKGEKTGSLNFKLSAALTSLDDCNTGLKETGKNANAALTVNKDLDEAIRVCLAVDKSNS